MRGWRRRLVAAAAVLGGALPTAADAQETGTRAVEAPSDAVTAMVAAAAAVVVLLLIATLGRLYQRQRGLHWRFQDPDPVHDDHASGH